MASSSSGDGAALTLSETEERQLLAARMQDAGPDLFRVVQVVDGAGRRITDAYLLRGGVSVGDAAGELMDVLTDAGTRVTEKELEEMAKDVMSPEETVARLRACGMKITRETLRAGLKQRVFPFGDFVGTEGGGVAYVYRRLLEAWIQERFGEAARGVQQ